MQIATAGTVSLQPRSQLFYIKTYIQFKNQLG